ncbi:dentin sialophosphoprotein [Biomphalaria pfeifferi]|uniref:Dentin sialophosphoprotein n=1 Tax=Biomphalaria pfeifferi TaxID=112525 RepID=A0AAD8BYT5_BIOPF|nr:dentin sialophosphoprotein [Biomphalaria pfeifferi]
MNIFSETDPECNSEKLRAESEPGSEDETKTEDIKYNERKERQGHVDIETKDNEAVQKSDNRCDDREDTDITEIDDTTTTSDDDEEFDSDEDYSESDDNVDEFHDKVIQENDEIKSENDKTSLAIYEVGHMASENTDPNVIPRDFKAAETHTLSNTFTLVVTYDNPNQEDLINSQTDMSKETNLNISQSSSFSSNYDYRDGTLAPDVDSDSLADSWDWTFPNLNVSELDIPAEQKYSKKKGRRISKKIPKSSRREVSVGTQTEEVTHLTDNQSASTITDPNVLQDSTSRTDQPENLKPKRKKKKSKKTEFDEDIVYFEDPSSSRLFKTKLLYLNTDSNVRIKSSSSWTEIRNSKPKRTIPEDPQELNHTFKSTFQDFEKRNVKRFLTKLPNIESKFIRPHPKSDVHTAETSRLAPTLSRDVETSLSMSKPNHIPLNSSLKLNNSMSDSHPLFGDAITERLINWRLARGRTMSRPDVFRRSMTRDELQRGIDDFLESIKEKRSCLGRFKHTARLVVLLLRAIGLKPHTPEEDSHNFLSWTVVYDEVLGISRLNYDSGTLTFDPLLYKANKETTVSDDVKVILQLPPGQRTQAHVHMVKVCFKQVAPSFSEFPIRIQESMIKVCTYDKFKAGRVIIRQGHRAENFYFILSGSVVTELDLYANHAHTTNVLGKGNSFGELALLNRSLRSATVTCREDVELIWIERQDFIDIFMARVSGKEADHITFLKTVELLQGWPVDRLPAQSPKLCAFTYVRRGVVLCQDSSKSDWIFVVVSGSCKILKALTDAPLNKQQKADIINERSTHLPSISIAPAMSNFATIYTMNNSNRLYAVADHSANVGINRTRRQGLVQRPNLVTESLNLLNKSEACVSRSQSVHQDEIEQIFVQKHILPPLQEVKSYANRPSEHNSSRITTQTLQLPPTTSLFQPKRQSYGLQPPALPQLVTASAQGPSNTRQVFIEVARLDSGDVFGLDQVVLVGVRKVTSFSLVSDGAEVVLINKKFFMKNLTEETMKDMRKKITPLPSEKVLQRNLETLKTWEAYKAATLSRYASWKQKLADVPEFSR